MHGQNHIKFTKLLSPAA